VTENDIICQYGSVWVAKTRDGYTVFVDNITHAISDATYALTPDRISIATASCRYKAGVEMEGWFVLAMDCLNDHRRNMFATYLNRGVSIWKELNE